MSEKKEELKKLLKILNKTMISIEKKIDDGKSLKDAELRFLNNYPEIRKKYETLIEKTLEEEK